MPLAQKRSVDTRASIIEAADRVFGELGFDAATTREIADLSGVNKALIHYHFKNKQQLFEAVLEGYYDALDDVVLAGLMAPGGVLERIQAALDAYVDFLADNQRFARMVQREASGGPHLETIVARTLPMFERAVELLERELPATRSGPLAAPQLLLSFYGMVISTFTYAPVLERLMDEALSEQALEQRKRHLRKMSELVAAALDESAKPREGTRT